MANGGKTWIPKKEKESDIYTSFLDGIREHTEKKEKYLPETSRYSTDDRTKAASENKDWKTKYTEKNYPFKLRDSQCLPSPFSSSYNSDWIREHTEKKEKYLPGSYRYSTYDRPEAAAIDKPLRTKFPEQNLPCEHEQPKSTTRSDSSTGEGHSSSGFRIVLLGRTGSGKSATGNSILGNYHFRSISSSLSETYKCTKGNTVREGKDVVVIDTPGMFDTDLQNYEVIKEINKSIEMTSPGPNVFILVLNVGRFTHEEKKTIEIFLQKFGEEILKYLIVLFTHRDDLEESEMSIEEYIDSTPPYVKKIIKLCNNRYTAFNNDIVDKGRDLQVNRLFGIISNMMWKNRCSCYTSSILQTVNTRNKKRSEQIDRDVHKKVKEDIRKLQDEIYKGFRDGLQTNVYKKQQLEDEFNAENKKQNRLELEIKRLQEQKRRL